MGFCTKCGRPRASGVRFCPGCGHDFGALAAERGGPVADTEAGPATPGQLGSLDWAGLPPAGEVTRPRSEPAAPWQPADTAAPWRMADTVSATPSQAMGYLPPVQPVPAGPPPPYAEPGGPRRRSGGGRTTALIIVAVLLVIAAGGGAYAFFSRSHGHATAQPPSSPAAATDTSTAAPAVEPTASPTAVDSLSPTASPSASATPSPTRTGAVQVVPSVDGNPAAPQVAAYLNRYFNAINTRNYSEYNSLLDAQEQQSSSKSSFDSGYATTTDSDETLTGITDTGGGNVTADVTFTSRQNAADSVDQSACTSWTISLYLVPQGSGYVMTAAPAGYHAAYAAC